MRSSLLYPVWFSCSIGRSIGCVSPFCRLPNAMAIAIADGADDGGGDGDGADDGGGVGDAVAVAAETT